MPSIFPEKYNGGLIVRDPSNGQPIAQPGVENASVPAIDINCDLTALPENCRAVIAPSQVNAIVSELINLFVQMDPAETWDCSRLDNLATAFYRSIQNVVGGEIGAVTCNLDFDLAQESPIASLIYCDGNTLKKWTVNGSDGLFQAVLEAMCKVPQGFIEDGNDRILFCGPEGLQKQDGLQYRLFAGNWLKNRQYNSNHMVVYENRLYMPNGIIPANTDFSVGPGDQQWHEVAGGGTPAWTASQEYKKDTVVSRNGAFYAANDDIPAGTQFVVGSSGLTWRFVNIDQAFVNDFDAEIQYGKNALVVYQNKLWRAQVQYGPAPFNPAGWVNLSGDINIYKGPWNIDTDYLENDVVERQGRIWAANDDIDAGTAFVIGTTGATWRELSPSFGAVWDILTAYPKGSLVSYAGNFFVANDDMPAGIRPQVPNIGVSGQTWSVFTFDPNLPLYDAEKSYVDGQLFLYDNYSGRQQDAIWRVEENGKAPGGVPDRNISKIVGERSRFRGQWSFDEYYEVGDLVFNSAMDDIYPSGYLFECQANIPPRENFQINSAKFLPKVKPGFIDGLYDSTKAYRAGSIVITPWGIFQANTGIDADEYFRVSRASLGWRSMNTGLPHSRLSGQLNYSSDDHQNRFLLFDYAGPKTYRIEFGNMFQDGDSISGVSINGQLTISAASDVTIITPEGNSLRNVNGAAFLLRCIGNKTYVLSGDLQTV